MQTLPSILAAGGFSAILTIAVFIVLSLISQWQQRRQRELDGDGPPSPKPRDPRSAPRPRAPGPLDGWEEQLKRLLEDPRTRAERPRPTPPPPRPRPLATPPPLAPEAGPDFQMPPLTEARRAMAEADSMPAQVDTRIDDASRHMGELPRAHQAMASAAKLQTAAHDHLYQGILRNSVSLAMRAPSAASEEARAVVAHIRSPIGVRQALIASLIFSPPKALQGD